jgi:predicted nucleic acid-binding protein
VQKILLDTSVVLAALIKNHIHFKAAFAWIHAIQQNKYAGYVSSHTLAELYSNLSQVYYEPVVPPDMAVDIIEKSVMETLKPVDLSIKDYRLALRRVGKLGLRGGVVYDSIHLQAAIKQDISLLLTINEKDFKRLVGSSEIKIINPLIEKP